MSGKIASGKSTLARSLAAEQLAILLSEDYWLSRLYPDQIKSVADYVRLAHQIRKVVGPLVTDVLNAGVSVVLDFPANTPEDLGQKQPVATGIERPIAAAVEYAH